MPFTEVSKNEKPVYATKQAPIFLIPGITGQGAELIHLISYLRENAPERQIFVWDDPRLPTYKKDHKEDEDRLTITKLCSIICTEIKNILSVLEIPNDNPCGIIGYSFGGIVAAGVAQQLQKGGKAVAPCIIDTPAPQTLKHHFNDKEAKKDFFTIMMHANRLSPDFDSLLIYSKITTQNLQSLNQSELKPEPKFDTLHTTMTTQSLDKYKCSIKGNWEPFSENITCSLLEGPHAAPLEKSNSEFVGESILNYLNSLNELKEPLEKNFVKSPFDEISSPLLSPLTASPTNSISHLSLDSDTSPSASDNSPAISPYSSPSSSPRSGDSVDDDRLTKFQSLHKKRNLSHEDITVSNVQLKENKPHLRYRTPIKLAPKLFVKPRTTRSNTKTQVERLTTPEDQLGVGNKP